ncbi:MAG TPA: CDGSH iron-sulfur domain-containing protein [Elusimicrobiota bacterium]|nr:CDGSH iron-sulfur domain-containing protein [Elusimicrobiota bacterium]
MDEPVIVEKSPVVLELDAGTYHWCACGRSKKQPFCDGSHKVTAFHPVAFTLTEKRKVVLCRCKHTKNPPFCDGTHKTL